MTQRFFLIIAVSTFLILFSCSSPKYIHDQSSFERQKELKKDRSGNVFTDIGLGIVSVFSSAALQVDVGWYPNEQEFMKLNLKNPTNDTMFVNMLTDLYWDKEDYCDFMDIRIPPMANCKILVPVNANYNLYFSNTSESDDDEMLEINTSDIRKIALMPGLTLNADTTAIEQGRKN